MNLRDAQRANCSFYQLVTAVQVQEALCISSGNEEFGPEETLDEGTVIAAPNVLPNGDFLLPVMPEEKLYRVLYPDDVEVEETDFF